MKIKSQIAKIYDLNILASALSKLQSCKLGEKSIKDIKKIIKYCVKEIYEVEKPLVPHNDPILIDETKKFADKLIKMLNTENVKGYLGKILCKNLYKILEDFKFDCEKLKLQKVKFFVSKEQIAEMFGFEEMWDIAQREFEKEAFIWKYAKSPTVPEKLKLPVNEVETNRLIHIFNTNIFGFNSDLKVNSKIVQNHLDYHLFWDITYNGVSYVTPEFYGMNNQLSFDFPHNVSHLAHLYLLKKFGVMAYVDDMATRAFFESIAVFSEYEMIEKLKSNPEIVSKIKAGFDSYRDMDNQKLLKWMIADREYQLKLRNVRLLSDILVVQGLSFNEVVENVRRCFKIPFKIAKSEVFKYYPWTGLGAIYTLGYRKLKRLGVIELKDILKGKPPVTWHDFCR